MKNKLITLLFLLGAILGGAAITTASATTFRVVQTPTLHLYTGLSASATTMRITPFPKDLNGTKLTMTDFGSSPTVTVDPKLSSYEEIVGFTAITDNGDNTATLTGLSRNLISKYPYTTTGTGRTHGAGAVVVFSNNPQLYGRLGALENDQAWTGTNTFASTSMPRYDVTPSAAMWAAAGGSELVDLNKLNATAIAGAANASETAAGIIEIATGLELASSTKLGSTGSRLVLPASLATSSPYAGASTTIPVTQTNGKLIQSFFDFTLPWTWTGLGTYSGGLTSTGTTTISASSLTTNPFTINSLPFKYPSTRGASSTVLMEDGSGNLTWEPTGMTLLNSSTTGVALTRATSTFATLGLQHLRVVLYVPSMNTGSNPALNFNTDAAGASVNYGWSVTEDVTATRGSAAPNIALSSTGTTSPAFYVIDVYNAASERKAVTWTGNYGSTGATAPLNIKGAATWNNTSAQITTVSVQCSAGCTIGSGTRIDVYGY